VVKCRVISHDAGGAAHSLFFDAIAAKSDQPE
jgi:hypothetical protein